MHANKNYLLIGPPNVGKSTYYNRITWKNTPVSNIDRVTTFASASKIRKEKSITVIDLPGVNTLNPHGDDEFETFKYLFSTDYTGVINIINANALKRDLLLTYQLAEAGVLSEILVNMVDEVSFTVNKLAMTTAFKTITECISARKNINIQSSLIPLIAPSSNLKTVTFEYNEKIERFINSVSALLPSHKLSNRFIIIQYLLENEVVIDFLNEHHLYEKFEKIKTQLKIDAIAIQTIYKTREAFVTKLLNKIQIFDDTKECKQYVKSNRFSKIADFLFLNKWIAIPLFILIMVAVYFLTFYEYAGGWIQSQFNDQVLTKLSDLIATGINDLNPGNDLQQWWGGFVSNGLLGGAFTIISFIPWIIILTFCISILEQVGLLSRMSIVFDRIFAKAGVSGRVLINLITGLGCNVPAIMMTRNCNSVKERVITAMLSPFVSCSARVIVYGFILQAVIQPQYTWLVTFAISLISLLVAFGVGYFCSNLYFRKKNSIFITELSKIRSPSFSVVLKKVFFESVNFIKRTIFIIAVANLIIWFLLYTTPTSKFIIVPTADAPIDQSFLRYISYPFQYLLYPIGLGNDWRFAISLITAFPAKEIAASNITILFGGIEGFNQAIKALPVAISLSYLIFFAFYLPCLATIVVMVSEIGWKYTLVNTIIGLGFSFLLGLTVYGIIGSIETIIMQVNNTAMIVILTITLVLIATAIVVNIYLKFKAEQLQLWDFNLSSWKAKLIYCNYFAILALILSLAILLLVYL